MTISQLLKKRRWFKFARPWRLHPTTLVCLFFLATCTALMAVWFSGYEPLDELARQAQWFQQHPPQWIQAPDASMVRLWLPLLALLGISGLTMRLSPTPRHWSRWVIVSLLCVVTVRYLLWRSLSTLNFATPLSGVLSVGLLGLELVTLTASTIQLLLLLRSRDRRREANILAEDVASERYQPSVDVLIPTYDEPAFILRRSIIGSQAMDYANKQVYLLDDTRRPDIQALAAELGCHYLTRPDNRHAKAGNLNHALGKTNGELIVVFDADFIPTTNFLTRTVGFFQKPDVAMVQTPQSFYNPDPLARNLRLESQLTPEEDLFYRQVQPLRDGTRSTTCCGSAFLMRRSHLMGLGGFDTDSIAEDYFTGIRLSAQGYDLVYLNEKLSAGLAPENMADYATQRIRWARGTLQGLFISANPLMIPGLTWVQRLVHLEGLFHWFTNFSRLGFLLMPLVYAFLGVIPIWATPNELVYFFLPYYGVLLITFNWLNERSRSALLSDVYSVALCVPMTIAVVQTLLRPFSRGFKVTPKGTQSDRYTFNWGLALPLLVLFVAMAFSLWINLGMYLAQGVWVRYIATDTVNAMKGYGLGWIWSAYNLILIGWALIILLDVPRPNSHLWFPLRRVVRLTVEQFRPTPAQALVLAGDRSLQTECHVHTLPRATTWQTLWGTTTLLSQSGAELMLTQPTDLPIGSRIPVRLELMEEQLALTGQMTITEAIAPQDITTEKTVRVTFDPLTLTQERHLIQLLFCRPGQWPRHQSPGELKTLWLLLRLWLKPHRLFAKPSDRLIATSH